MVALNSAQAAGVADARRLETLLTSGGDERIEINLASGLNRYGCAVRPRAGEIAFSSSTASTLSAAAYAAAGESLDRLLASSDPARAYELEMERLRGQLTLLCGLPPSAAQDLIFGASGTDLLMIVADLARGASPATLTVVMADPEESGRGAPLALTGRSYGQGSPFGGRAPLPGAEAETGRLVAVAVRQDDGRARPAEAVDADTERACARAVRGGGPLLLTVLDVSKTGLMVPSLACAARLKARYGAGITVVVDACQFRLSSASLGWALAQDFLVAVTGSKFFGGPPFSGALFVPPASAARLRALPLSRRLGDYSARAEWPAGYAGRQMLPALRNLGLILRWQAALHEMAAFRSLPQSAVSEVLQGFATAMAGHLGRCDRLVPLFAPALERPLAGGWDSIPTIFPFLIHGRSGPLKSTDVQGLYERLRAQKGVRFGQPVTVGRRDGAPVSALRLSVGARDVVEALSCAGGCDALAERAGRALALTAEAARADS